MILAAGLIAFAVGSAGAADFPLRPNGALTPGEASPALTQDKICSKNFRTGSVRNVPAGLKRQVYRAYGLSQRQCKAACARGCEIDHLQSLELGGANTAANLWPQLYCGEWSAVRKDQLENKLHELVCKGEMTLQDAAQCITSDWIACWLIHLSSTPSNAGASP